jgi:uncharacterized protein (DUF58 family)
MKNAKSKKTVRGNVWASARSWLRDESVFVGWRFVGDALFVSKALVMQQQAVSQLSVVEILRKVRRIQLVANRAVNALFAGQYKSVFRGRGMEFDEVREYQPGDDIRDIDWNVTARTGSCYIKRFCEERELTVQFLVDVSASGAFGSTTRSKLDLAVEIAALLMFSALKNNDKVGLLAFCDNIVEYLPPRKGKSHVLRIIRALVSTPPVAGETDWRTVLEFLDQVQKRRAVVFLISDFLGPLPRTALAVANERHDLVAITLSDRRECVLEDVGFVSLVDAESGATIELDTRSAKVRARFAHAAAARAEQLARDFQRLRIDQLAVDTEHDYTAVVRRFFQTRERRFR